MNLCSRSNIVRLNCFYGCNESGVMMSCVANYPTSPAYNRVYNNTFYTNGFSTISPTEAKSGIGMANWGNASPIVGNAIKNNLFYRNPVSIATYSVNLSDQIIAGNWQQSGDPLFVDITSPMDVNNSSIPNLQLRTNSPCIDKAVYLTTITSASGSGKVVQVADATYFIDGWGIIEGDNIQLQGGAQQARIVAIDYSTQTLTLDTALTWTQGQGMSLPFKGAGPDIGAFEAGTSPVSVRPAAPTNLRIITVL